MNEQYWEDFDVSQHGGANISYIRETRELPGVALVNFSNEYGKLQHI